MCVCVCVHRMYNSIQNDSGYDETKCKIPPTMHFTRAPALPGLPRLECKKDKTVCRENALGSPRISGNHKSNYRSCSKLRVSPSVCLINIIAVWYYRIFLFVCVY